MEWLWIVLGVVLVAIVVGIYLWASYNGLARLGARVDGAWRELAAQLERRADLVPGLIEVVRGYAAHEKDAFEQLARARQDSIDARTPSEAAIAESAMQRALRAILAVAEAYPQLQASQGFLQLQSGLHDIEDQLQAARRRYNGGVRELGTRIQGFPDRLFAKGLDLEGREFFEAGEAASIAEPPRIQF